MTALMSPRLRDCIVGVADLKVSNNVDDRLLTYALGSCLGVAVYDPVAHVGGLLHVMLPNCLDGSGKDGAEPRDVCGQRCATLVP